MTEDKSNPDREIYNVFATLNKEQEREKHDIYGLYLSQFRANAQKFEGVKRNFERFTGMRAPEKLRTSSDPESEVARVKMSSRRHEDEECEAKRQQDGIGQMNISDTKNRGQKRRAQDMMDTIKEDANAEVPEPRKKAPFPGGTASICEATNNVMDLAANEGPKPPAAAAKKPASKSTLKPSKYTNSSVVKSTPNLPAPKARAKKTNISSILAQTSPYNAANEARAARLAEMRQKANAPTAKVGALTDTTGPNSKDLMSSTLKKMSKKPKYMPAEVREKVAADDHTENGAPAAQAVKPAGTSQQAPKPSSTAPKAKPAAKPAPKKPKEKQLSPMQTYEMTEDSETGSESESESESEADEDDNKGRPKKTVIPEWAQKANLHRALEKQFADGPDRLDPDEIFGEVLTCNLEEIFDEEKPRYNERTSSGNWSKDHVTLAEKLTYKRNMGYDK